MSAAKLSIATYSAHESILNALNQKCTIERLFVNAGGLRVPPGIRSDKPYLSKYKFVNGKTLHAKVAFFSEGNKKDFVWLWTGNLRKSTFESQNILMNFPIEKDEDKLEKWFSEGCKQHVIFKGSKKKIVKIFPSDETMWENFKKSLSGEMSEKAWKAEKNVHVYIFSPWGAKKVVEKIRDYFGEARLSIYTQAAADDENLWVDCCEKDERYVASKNAKFPHFKCMFVCRGKELVWSYVGSANFTQSAMLEQKNVEHALFFEGKPHNEEQQILLEQLKKLGWERRKSKINPVEKKEDPNVEQKYESRYDPQSFIEQDIANKVLTEFSSKAKQKELEASYTKNKGKGAKVKSKDKSYELKVLALEREQIYVKVYPQKSLPFELSIPRIDANSIPIVTQADVSAKFDELDSIAFGNGNGGGGGGGSPQKGDCKKDSPTNVRFPMEFYKGDSETKRSARKRALKIIGELQYQHLDKSQKLKLDIWLPLLKRLGV